MYAVEVRDHIMIAHSFRGELFGPAQRLHGATFVVDVAFFREALTADEVVVDIGRAHDALKATLAPLNYRNLDEIAAIRGPADHHRISLAPYLRRHGGRGALGRAGAGRRGDRTHPRDAARVACRARLVRGSGRPMRIIFAAPGDLSARTGGYGYDRAVIAALPEFDVEVAHVALKGSFPFPSEAEARATRRKRSTPLWRQGTWR